MVVWDSSAFRSNFSFVKSVVLAEWTFLNIRAKLSHIMKYLFLISVALGMVTIGCTAVRNEELSDSQIPPEDQLVKVAVETLASDFSRGKKKSLNQDNDAKKTYSYKWLKLTGRVDDVHDQGDGLGYTIKFAADPSVQCIGNLPEGSSPALPKEGDNITVVGKLISDGSGASPSLILNPCKFQ